MLQDVDGRTYLLTKQYTFKTHMLEINDFLGKKFMPEQIQQIESKNTETIQNTNKAEVLTEFSKEGKLKLRLMILSRTLN